MRRCLLLVAILLCANVVEAQITLDDYRRDVARHSHTIGISNSEVDASLMDVKRARKGYLPSVVSYRTMSYAFDKQGDERRFDWSMRPEINQTVYAGGAVRAAVKQAEARYDASIGSADDANLTVRYEADVAYWELSRAENYRRAVADYVQIIESLRNVVAHRFEEGYTAKGDLLQVESRRSDAEYQLIAAEQRYLIALHNFNVLRGEDASAEVVLAEDIMDTLNMPMRQSVSAIMERHPEYRVSLALEEQSRWAIRAEGAEFMPSMGATIYGDMHPNIPNVKGAGTHLGGGILLSFTTPIFHFRERKVAVGAARRRYDSAQMRTAELAERILLDESNGWTNLLTTRKRVDATRRNLDLAKENLDISTYAYNEGLTTILDVLQAQISWLQIYTNAITAQYDYAVAVATYQRLTATMP